MHFLRHRSGFSRCRYSSKSPAAPSDSILKTKHSGRLSANPTVPRQLRCGNSNTWINSCRPTLEVFWYCPLFGIPSSLPKSWPTKARFPGRPLRGGRLPAHLPGSSKTAAASADPRHSRGEPQALWSKLPNKSSVGFSSGSHIAPAESPYSGF